MTDDLLQSLAAGPLADPNKIFLPRGRKTGQRKRSPDELEVFRQERAAKKARLAREAADHLAKLFAYYAATTVPFDRVVAHIGLNETRVREGLREHGRELDPAEVAQFEAMRAARLEQEGVVVAARLARSPKGKGKRK